MDYTYACGLEGNAEFLGVATPIISSTPSEDFVIPGSGNLVHLYPTFVPIHSRSQSQNTIVKKVEDDFSGQGVVDVASNNTDKTESDNLDAVANSESETKASTSKGQKRSLPEGLLDSFLHPKLLKTDTIKFEHKPRTPKQTKPNSTPKNITQNHKFKVVD